MANGAGLNAVLALAAASDLFATNAPIITLDLVNDYNSGLRILAQHVGEHFRHLADDFGFLLWRNALSGYSDVDVVV